MNTKVQLLKTIMYTIKPIKGIKIIIFRYLNKINNMVVSIIVALKIKQVILIKNVNKEKPYLDRNTISNF